MDTVSIYNKDITQQNEDELVKNVYEKIAGHFDNTRAYVWSWISDFKSNITDDDIYVDIGCGNGRNLRESNCIGIDNCESFLQICREKYTDIPLYKCCITNLDKLNDKSCDWILCIAMFHHLTTRERRIDALREMKRILKPGKSHRVLLSVWSINQPKKTRRTFHYGDNIVKWNKFGKIYNRYYYIFRLEELKELFEETGWKIYSHKWDCGNEAFEMYYE